MHDPSDRRNHDDPGQLVMPKTAIVVGEEPTTNNHVRGLLTASDILDADDIVAEYVEVPEWGGTVKIMGLSGEARNRVGALMRAEGKKTSEDEALAFFQMRVIAASMVDEDGKRLFSQNDVHKLAAKSAGALQRVYDACARISGLSETAVEDAKQDLKATSSDDTGTD